MGELSDDLDRAVRRLVGRRIEDFIEDGVGKSVMETLKGAAVGYVHSDEFRGVVRRSIAVVAGSADFTRTVREAVEDVISRELFSAIHERLNAILASAEVSSVIGNVVMAKIETALATEEMRARLDDFARVLVEEATKRMVQQMFTRPGG